MPANKYAHAIFCSSKIRYLGQGVRSFLVGLSGESCFMLRSSLWDKWKTFWLSLQGERACGEKLWAMPKRTQAFFSGEGRKDKKVRENALIKQFLLIITQFGVSIFILHWRTCRASWKWFDTTPFAREVDCFSHYSMSPFLMTFHHVIYLPVKTQ